MTLAHEYERLRAWCHEHPEPITNDPIDTPAGSTTFPYYSNVPEPNRLVIVAGGVALWTGSVWLSKTGDDNCRVITWPVKWWMPLAVGDERPLYT
jgi:hypothetical protein